MDRLWGSRSLRRGCTLVACLPAVALCCPLLALHSSLFTLGCLLLALHYPPILSSILPCRYIPQRCCLRREVPQSGTLRHHQLLRLHFPFPETGRCGGDRGPRLELLRGDRYTQREEEREREREREREKPTTIPTFTPTYRLTFFPRLKSGNSNMDLLNDRVSALKDDTALMAGVKAVHDMFKTKQEALIHGTAPPHTSRAPLSVCVCVSLCSLAPFLSPRSASSYPTFPSVLPGFVGYTRRLAHWFRYE